MSAMEQPEPFEPPDDVCKAAEALADIVLTGQTWHTEETFVRCEACGEWDSHTDACFVPALLAWMKE